MNNKIFLISCIFSLTSNHLQAQSIKDLLNKEIFNQDNLSKVVDAVTKQNKEIDITGTWSFSGSAIELESNNLLMQMGGEAAANMTENKLDEQLNKVGIRPNEMSFTFNSDSTFTSMIGKKNIQGTYSYNDSTQQVELKFYRFLNLNAKVKYSEESMDLLFKSEKLLKLITFIGSKSKFETLKALSTLTENYDGMMIGFELKKSSK